MALVTGIWHPNVYNIIYIFIFVRFLYIFVYIKPSKYMNKCCDFQLAKLLSQRICAPLGDLGAIEVSLIDLLGVNIAFAVTWNCIRGMCLRMHYYIIFGLCHPADCIRCRSTSTWSSVRVLWATNPPSVDTTWRLLSNDLKTIFKWPPSSGQGSWR